jgi:putative Mg2+ transporter-C (MgtC) family protein
VADACAKFGLAVILAGALGLERQRKGRAAGLRTHIMVCLGATLVMVVSGELARHLSVARGSISFDTGRVAAGVITGIGFLGAGTIIRVGIEQRGLTTAALIWFVAALGIAIGAGLYVLSILATVFALVVVLGLGYVERALPAYEHFTIRIRAPKGLERLVGIETAIRERGFAVIASRIRVGGGDHVDMAFDVSASGGPRIEELAAVLRLQLPDAERIDFER